MAQDPNRPKEPTRENVPGELDHASGEVDEFEAALVAGAGGTPPDDPDAAETAFAEDDGDRRAPTAATNPPASASGGPRFLAFLKACWAELQRVQWPDRRQVGQATAVVIGFVIVAGTFLGVADRLASELVDLII